MLAELLLAEPVVDQGLFDAYTDRRARRARTVVENSVQLARWLLDHEPPPQAGGTADVPGLMGRTAALLAQRP